MRNIVKNFVLVLTAVFFLEVSISKATAFILEAIGPPGNIPIISLAIDPSNPSILYGGSVSNNYIYKSANGGVDWEQLSAGLPEISLTYMISIDPSDPSILYVSTTEDGVFKSITGGENWTPINNELGDIRSHNRVFIDPTNTSTIYVGTEGGVFKSLDGGQNWSSRSIGLPGGEVNIEALDPLSPSTLYAGKHYDEVYGGGGLYKTIDGGENWDSVNNGLPSPGTPESAIEAVTIDPTNNQIVYAGTDGGGVFKSTDGGQSWVPHNQGLTHKNVYGITIHPSNSAVLHVGTLGGGLFISSNGGDSWWQLLSQACLKEDLVVPLAYNLSDPSILYIVAVDIDTLSSGNLYKGIGDQINRCSIGQPWLTLLLDDDTNGFTYAELSGNTFQLTDIDYPKCVEEVTFINNQQFIGPDGGTYNYTIDIGCIILDPGPDSKLCVKSRVGDEVIAEFSTNGGEFVDQTDQWGIGFSFLNNDATALKNWFVTNGFWPNSAILADGRVTNQDASIDGNWWIDQNVFYFAYPESDGCVDYKAYKLVNDRLMFATDAAHTQTYSVVNL